jgi:hypothetical protein
MVKAIPGKTENDGTMNSGFERRILTGRGWELLSAGRVRWC